MRSDEAARLRRLRDVLGWTQRELAAEFNVTHGAIAGWEAGKRTLSGPALRLLALYEAEVGLGETESGSELRAPAHASPGGAPARTPAGTVVRIAARTLEAMLASNAPRGSVAERAQSAVAKALVGELARLKALALKFGQTLSILDFLLPEASRAELGTLVAPRTALSPAVVAEIVHAELGAPPRRLFAEWSGAPFAVGSIGQVHRARLPSGEAVAVKVQYPGIAAAVRADLETARLLERFTAPLFRAQRRGEVLAELEEHFLEECDYRSEARHQELFRSLWDEHDVLRVPRVHAELSSRRVLVTELVEGEDFGALSARASQEQRDRAGMALFQFAFESILKHGVFNADPHPANHRFVGDRVACLDFGCVKRFDPGLLAAWRGIIRAALEQDAANVRRLWVEVGMIPDPAHFDFAYHERMLRTLYEPWLTDAPFQFTPEFVERTWRALVLDNPNRFRTNLPKDWVFVNRLQWGLYAVLGKLGATGHFRRVLLDLIYAPGEARPPPFDPSRALA